MIRLMKKEITVGQLLSVAVTLLIALATGWITITNKVTRAEDKIQAIEAQQSQERLDFRKSVDELKWKMEDLNSNVTKILVELERKANRKQ